MKNKGFSKGALIGAVAGALAGILFAPRSGKETRDNLVKNVESIQNELVEKLGRLESFSKKVYDDTVGGLIAGYEDARKITPKEAEEIKNILQDSFKKIERTIRKK